MLAPRIRARRYQFPSGYRGDILNSQTLGLRIEAVKDQLLYYLVLANGTQGALLEARHSCQWCILCNLLGWQLAGKRNENR
jgi:hypothetical protein